LEEAAIRGHPDARFNLGCEEEGNGNMQRAVKHFIIAANLGHDKALDAVRENFVDGFVSKEDFESALRGHHQAALDATKSEQTDAAEGYHSQGNQH